MAHEARALQEQRGLEAGDVRAIALPNLQDAQLRQRTHRFAEGVPGQAQLRRQLALLRQPIARSPAARDDQLLDLVDRIVGDAWVASQAARRSGVGHCHWIVGHAREPAKRSDVIASRALQGPGRSFGWLTNIGALAYNSEPRWVLESCGPSRAISASRPREPSMGRMR